MRTIAAKYVWEEIQPWFWLTFSLFLVFLAVRGIYLQDTGWDKRYYHSLSYRLAGKDKDVKWYKEETEKARDFIFSVVDTTNLAVALDISSYSGAQRRNKLESQLKAVSYLIQTSRAIFGRGFGDQTIGKEDWTEYKSAFDNLKLTSDSMLFILGRINEMDNNGDLKRMCENDKLRPLLISAIHKSVDIKSLPDTSWNLFPGLIILLTWVIYSILVFLVFLVYWNEHEKSSGVKLWQLEYKSPWTDVIILIHAPVFVPFLSIAGLIVGIPRLVKKAKEWRLEKRQIVIEEPVTQPAQTNVIEEREVLTTVTEGTPVKETEKPEIIKSEKKPQAIKWYIVEGFIDGQLKESGITYTKVNITRPKSVEAIAFPSNELNRFFEFFRISPRNLKESSTDISNGIFLTFEDAAEMIAEKRMNFNNSKEKVRSAYIQACTNRIRLKKAKLEQHGKYLQNEISNSEQSLAELIRGFRDCEGELQFLEQLQKSPVKSEEHFGDEFDQICSYPGIAFIEVIGTEVKVYTKTIFAEYQGKYYEIGEFEIVIRPDQGTHIIRNISTKIGEYDHPHLRNGKTCYGNLSEGIAKILAEYQYGHFLHVILEFLTKIDGEYNALCPPSKWKEVSKDEVERRRKLAEAGVGSN